MSAVIEGFMAVLLAIIAYTSNKQLTVQKDKGGGLTVLNEKGAVIAKIPPIRLESLNFSSAFGKRLSTTNTKKQDVADFSIKSQDRDVRILAISFVPDLAFQTKGILRLEVNKQQIFPQQGSQGSDAGFFTDLSGFALPIPAQGILLKRGESLDIFLWTSDGTLSNLTCAGYIGEYV